MGSLEKRIILYKKIDMNIEHCAKVNGEGPCPASKNWSRGSLLDQCFIQTPHGLGGEFIWDGRGGGGGGQKKKNIVGLNIGGGEQRRYFFFYTYGGCRNTRTARNDEK